MNKDKGTAPSARSPDAPSGTETREARAAPEGSARLRRAALADIASGNYFEPAATRRIVVLLTDGESNPVDGSSA